MTLLIYAIKSLFFSTTNLHRFTLFPKRFKDYEKELIIKELSFYNKLSEKDKVYFEHRVLRFIEEHEFVGREGLVITEKMKFLVAAVAVKVTFGFRRYLFSNFKTILIFPEHYFSNLTKQYHKGEANPKYKTIVFSWDDFKEGIKIENDNLNLGIHEFTHAMHFSFLSEKSYSATHFLEHYRILLKFLEDKAEQKKLIQAKYLRAYGYENQYEFLAVLVEHFFETPEEFKTKLPEIYTMVKKMLNINVAGY